MKRKVIDALIEWKDSHKDKPVLLTGAKGVGKTYLAYDFAKAFFEHIYYINFERESHVHSLFEPSELKEVRGLLIKHFRLQENDFQQNSILILDEISFCPEAMKWINSLQNSEVFSRIIIISSKPLPEEDLFLVHSLPIYPLEFDEFLRATANEWYIEAITTHFETNKAIPEIVHNELLTLHQLYMQIGGMPGAVNEYLNFSSLTNIAEQHSLQFGAYHNYIMKCNLESDALKMNQVLDSLALQLMKDNKKFQYKLIRKGTTHAMYKDAIQQLSDRNYVLQSFKVTTELLSNQNNNNIKEEELKNDAGTNFKLYLPDIGLLNSKIAEEQKNPSEAVLRKALLENYIAQAFHAKGYPLMFWESESMAKMDFILQKENNLIPVELHISDNTRSKSISILKQKYDFPYAIKISSKNFDYSNHIKFVPYYAVFCL